MGKFKEEWSFAVQKIFFGSNKLGFEAMTPHLAVQMAYAFDHKTRRYRPLDDNLLLHMRVCLILAARFIESAEINLKSIKTTFDLLLSTKYIANLEKIVL